MQLLAFSLLGGIQTSLAKKFEYSPKKHPPWLKIRPGFRNFFLGGGGVCKFLSAEYNLAALHYVNAIRIF